LATDTLNTFLKKFNSVSPVYTWPHHFDTAILIQDPKGYSVGIGLALPDQHSGDFYFYVAGYKNNTSIPVANLLDLQNGKWLKNIWDGAIIPVKGANNEQLLAFYSEATQILLNYKE
jgi:hypothetical protein